MARKFIASYTVSAANEAAVVFSNISQGYKDLVLECYGRASGDSRNYCSVYPNSDTTGGNYTYRWFAFYDGSSTTAASGTGNGFFAGISAYSPSGASSAYANGSCEFYIPNYTATDKYKSCDATGLASGNTTNMMISRAAILWNSNSAITSLRIVPTSNSATWLQNSHFDLYGIS